MSGINIQEAVTKHLLPGCVLVSPSVTLPRKRYLFGGEVAQDAAALVEMGLWVLRLPRGHLGSCSMLTSVAVLVQGMGWACSSSLKAEHESLSEISVLWADLTKGTWSGNEGEGIPECPPVRFPCNSQGVCKENRFSDRFLILPPARLLPNSQSLHYGAAGCLPLLQTCTASC